MLLLELSPPLRAHVWVALKAHERQLRNDGRTPPLELVELAEALAPDRDAVTRRDPQPDPAARARQLSAARSARYRARKRRAAATRA
jgi:hypothetical protein